MNLASIGWGEPFASAFQPFAQRGLAAGRVASSLRGAYILWAEAGEVEAPARRKILKDADTRPCAGDWVAFRADPPLIEATLPRRSKISRKAPGEATAEQILAANIDVLFIVAGLDRDYNPRRLERYMAIAWDSGARPVIVLNKTDLCDDVAARVSETREVAGGAAVLSTSAVSDQGIEEMRALLAPGATAALIGSSGVGKSALTNRLLGFERREVGEVREGDGRGRHTTVGRELVLAPQGWILMDLPGIREVQPWSETGVEEAFEDIEALVLACRFSDCKHETEPGCSVREALDSGNLDPARYANYVKVQEEAAALGRRKSELAEIENKRNLRRVHKAFRKTPKRR